MPLSQYLKIGKLCRPNGVADITYLWYKCNERRRLLLMAHYLFLSFELQTLVLKRLFYAYGNNLYLKYLQGYEIMLIFTPQ